MFTTEVRNAIYNADMDTLKKIAKDQGIDISDTDLASAKFDIWSIVFKPLRDDPEEMMQMATSYGLKVDESIKKSVDQLLGEGGNISDVVSALKNLLKLIASGNMQGNPYTKREVLDAILALHSIGEYSDPEYAEGLLKSANPKQSKIAQRNQRLFPKTEEHKRDKQ